MNAQTIATHYAEAARKNYERDGFVTPCLVLLGTDEGGVMLMPEGARFGGLVREQFAALILTVADRLEVAYMSAVTEAWTKTAHKLEEADSIMRGDLSIEADTNPEVRTCIVVQTFNVRIPDESHSVMSTVKGDPRSLEWDTMEFPGVMGGEMPDVLMSAYQAATIAGSPDPFAHHTLAERVQLVVDMKLASAGIVIVPENHPERNHN